MAAPDGTRWTIRRAWAHRPWPVRWRKTDKAWSAGDMLEPVGALADIHPIFAGAALVVFAVFLIVAVAALLLVLVDVVVLAALVAVGILLRVALRRPWRIQASSRDGRTLTWDVTGYRRSRRIICQIESALRQGAPLPPPPH